MPFARSILVVAVVGIAFAGCGSTERPEASIRGIVLRGPMCPVESASSPCPDQPYAGVEVHATFEGDMVVDSDVTDANGRFELTVDGGATYRVSVLVEPIEQQQPQQVRVEPGGSAQVTLRVDTGIR